MFHLYRRIHSSRLLLNVTGSQVQSTIPNSIPFRDTNFRIHASSILVRNPLTLRALSPFEKAYEQYQLELQRERSRGVFDIMTAHKREMAQMQSGEGTPLGGRETGEAFLPKKYAEAEQDLGSLMRKLERKLYFVSLNEEGQWRFPAIFVPSADLALHKVR